MSKPDEPPKSDADERMQHERKLKHLEFLQTEIRRHSSESARFKLSSLAVIVGILIVPELDLRVFALVAILSTLVHWGLDGEAFRKELRFRALYDDVRSPDTTRVDFCMDDSTPSERAPIWERVVLSRKLLGYHLTLAVAATIARWGSL